MLYKNDKVLKDLIISLKDEFRFRDEGDLETFIGVNFNRKNHDALDTNQPHLTERILETLKFNDHTKMHQNPENCLLHKDKDG